MKREEVRRKTKIDSQIVNLLFHTQCLSYVLYSKAIIKVRHRNYAMPLILCYVV